MFQRFIDAFAQAFPDSRNLLLLDNSGAHTAQGVQWPEHVRCVWLPPYGLELNPIERVGGDVKEDVAWRQVADLHAQQAAVGNLLGPMMRPPSKHSQGTLTWWKRLLHFLYR